MVRDSSFLHDFFCHANCFTGTKVQILTRRGEKEKKQQLKFKIYDGGEEDFSKSPPGISVGGGLLYVYTDYVFDMRRSLSLVFDMRRSLSLSL